MIRKFHNHTLHTNPWHHKEEPQNTINNMASESQLSKATSSLFPLNMIARRNKTRQETQNPQNGSNNNQ